MRTLDSSGRDEFRAKVDSVCLNLWTVLMLKPDTVFVGMVGESVPIVGADCFRFVIDRRKVQGWQGWV